MKGTIRRRGENSFELRFEMPRGADGKRRRQTVSFTGNKRDAERRLRDLITRAEGGMPLDTEKATLATYLEKWLESHASKVRVRTLYGYKRSMELYVIPKLGQFRLTQLPAVEIEAMYNGMLERGLSPRTVLQTHRILKKALKQAVRWNMIIRNPVDLVDPPKFEGKEMLTLTPEQLMEAMDDARDEYPCGGAIIVAAHTGMRRGEIAGLQWPDIDFDNKMISVNRELVFVLKKGYMVTPPKSAKGRRAIDASDSLISELQLIRKAQLELRLRAGSKWNESGWVFTNPTGGHLNPCTISRAFADLRDRLELPPVRLHDLRHTHASIMLRAGVHLKVVQERLGHSTTAITGDIYSHVAPGLQKKAAEDFDAVLKAGKKKEKAASV